MYRRSLLVVYLALLTALLALAFGPHVVGRWIWDDVYLVRDNANVHGGVSGLWSLLSRDLWGSAGRKSSELYHPVPMALMWLVARGGGQSVVPFRVVNVLIHAACVVLFAAWLKRRGVPARGLALTSLLFAVHPLVTEPVMWITGCHDTLGTLGCLLALWVWPGEDDRHVALRVAGASIAAVWAALCKEPYFVLPAILTAVAVIGMIGEGRGAGGFHRDRLLRRIAPALGPLFGVGLVVVLRHRLGIPTGSARLHVPLSTVLVDYATVVFHYLRRSLTFDGGSTAEAYHALTGGQAALVLLFLASVGLILFVRWLRGNPGAQVAAIGWAWFTIALAPHALGTPSIGMFGNRYAYFPMMGLGAALLALGAPLALRRETRVLHILRFVSPLVPFAVVPFTALYAQRWQDELTLFGADLERNPDDSRALYHYGHAVRMEGGGCEAALPFFARSAEKEPGYARAWHNVAGCLVDLRRYGDAVEPAETAYRLQPEDSGAAYNLAVARLGTGDAIAARALLAHAVSLDPHHAGARRLLAQVSGTPESPLP
jgi:hypothetical protein